MTTPHLQRDVQLALDGAPFELGEHGLYCHRNAARTGLRRAEEALAKHGPVRVLDFTHGPELLGENVVPSEDADPGDYDGVPSCSGHRVFRVDHHYEVRSLGTVSTTPLVIRWIRGLWRRGRSDLLAELEASRYLADHADTDILLSNHAASRAADPGFAHGRFARWLEAAALRNDYVVLPSLADEPQASRIFYACLGIEDDILAGRLAFGEAQRRVLPQLEPWVSGEGEAADPQIAARLDAWEATMRAKEGTTLARIGAWEAGGRLVWEHGGRLAILEAEEKIDNADLYLYFVRGGRTPWVQALIFPEPGDGDRRTIKLRAHGGFDLNPLFARLNGATPQARFGGRAAAGGSKPVDRPAVTEIVDNLRAALVSAARA